jgi:hypothetical protein
MFFDRALSPQLIIQITNPVCINRRDVNRSAKAAKQNMQIIMLMRLNTIFDDIAASLTPRSRAIYDADGTKMVFAEMTMMAAMTITVQLR